MSTINISLPEKQAEKVDALVEEYGYANRSEFVRSILRVVIHYPKLLHSAVTFPFAAPKEKSRKKILKFFLETKKYSSAFLKDLEEGLEASEYFKP